MSAFISFASSFFEREFRTLILLSSFLQHKRARNDILVPDMVSPHQNGPILPKFDCATQTENDCFEPETKTSAESDENEIKFEFFTGKFAMYTADEKQLYRRRSRSNKMRWYQCMIRDCPTRLCFDVSQNKCFRKDPSAPHSHDTCVNKHHLLKLKNEIKKLYSIPPQKLLKIYENGQTE